MSTRGLIGRKNVDKAKSVSYIYCHHDSYFSHLGEVLFKKYQDNIEIDKLIDNGDISSLDIDGTPDFYGDTESMTKFIAPTESFWEESIGTEYWYLWDGAEWFTSSNGGKTILSLEKALENHDV